MKTSHTPGPWEYIVEAENARSIEIMSTGEWSSRIGRVYNYKTQASKANAKLIAAAPDLLEALKDIIHANDTGMGKSAVDLRISLAKDAIKKATE